MARPINIDAPLSAGIRRNKPGKKKNVPVKKASVGGIKKRFGGAGKPVRRQSGGPSRGGPIRRPGPPRTTDRSIPSNENREVRINLSNLAPSVASSDLRQLFSEFRIKHVSVNFNEKGVASGTGDITLPKRHADRLVQKFAGVALDGKEMKFAIIDTANIANRVKFPDTPQRAPRPSNQRNPKKPVGKAAGKPTAQKKNVKAKKPKREPQVKKTVEEMDAELDAYMGHAQ
uniref:FoP_duplication domain-containing protein n=1 Tax=Caenorhabditis tropicalis TaxID=1561998 RepID=A0A1I7TQT2_9PELO